MFSMQGEMMATFFLEVGEEVVVECLDDSYYIGKFSPEMVDSLQEDQFIKKFKSWNEQDRIARTKMIRDNIEKYLKWAKERGLINNVVIKEDHYIVDCCTIHLVRAAAQSIGGYHESLDLDVCGVKSYYGSHDEPPFDDEFTILRTNMVTEAVKAAINYNISCEFDVMVEGQISLGDDDV